MTGKEQGEALDRWLNDRVDEHVAAIEEQFKQWFRKALIAIAIIGLACTAALVGFGYLLNEQRQFDTNLQENREQFIRFECQDINERNRNTIAALENGLGDALAQADTQVEREQIKDSRAFTITLIDALVPIKNCEALVATTQPDE